MATATTIAPALVVAFLAWCFAVTIAVSADSTDAAVADAAVVVAACNALTAALSGGTVEVGDDTDELWPTSAAALAAGARLPDGADYVLADAISVDSMGKKPAEALSADDAADGVAACLC